MDSIKNKLRSKFKIKKKSIMIIFILILSMTVIFVFNPNAVYGKINSSYGSEKITGTINVEKTTKDNFVLDADNFLNFSILRMTKFAFLSSGLCSKNL